MFWLPYPVPQAGSLILPPSLPQILAWSICFHPSAPLCHFSSRFLFRLYHLSPHYIPTMWASREFLEYTKIFLLRRLHLKFPLSTVLFSRASLIWNSTSLPTRSLLLCCWKRVFAMTSAFSWQNSISLCPTSFHTPRPNLPVTPGVSWHEIKRRLLLGRKVWPT